MAADRCSRQEQNAPKLCPLAQLPAQPVPPSVQLFGRSQLSITACARGLSFLLPLSFRWPTVALLMIQTEIAAYFACLLSLHFSSCFSEKDLLGKQHEMSGSGLVFPTLTSDPRA